MTATSQPYAARTGRLRDRRTRSRLGVVILGIWQYLAVEFGKAAIDV